MLVVSFSSGAGGTRSLRPVEEVRLVGNAVQLGSQHHTVASYAAGLWFYGAGQETFDRLAVEKDLEIQFESPSEHRSIRLPGVNRLEVVDAEMRVGGDQTIARLDDRLQNWYLNGSAEAWPVVVLQAAS